MRVLDDLGITPRELREVNEPPPANPLEQFLAKMAPPSFREVVDRGIAASPELGEGRAAEVRRELREWADAQDGLPGREPPRLGRRDRSQGALREALGEEGREELLAFAREEADERAAMAAAREDARRRPRGGGPSPPCWVFPN